MAASDKVILLHSWASMFGMRARIALEVKGVEYEYREEDLRNKSPLLLEMNPVHKKIPVLIHNGRSISESLIIVQYIDEIWTHKSSLLPSDPYRRAQARFWADFIDQKIYMLGRQTWLTKGEEVPETVRKEFVGCFKLLEGELGDKKFFGGDTIGYVDVALVGFTAWFKVYEVFGNANIEKECPKLAAWCERCMEVPGICKSVPDREKIFEFVSEMKRKFGI